MGDYLEAERRYQQSLTIFDQLEDQVSGANSYSQLGILYAVTGRTEESVPLHCTALAIRLSVGVPHAKIDLDALVELRRRLGDEVFCEAAASVLDAESLTNLLEILEEHEGSGP